MPKRRGANKTLWVNMKCVTQKPIRSYKEFLNDEGQQDLIGLIGEVLSEIKISSLVINKMCQQSVAQFWFKPGALGWHHLTAIGYCKKLFNTHRI
jgi:hypothetical protein